MRETSSLTKGPEMDFISGPFALRDGLGRRGRTGEAAVPGVGKRLHVLGRVGSQAGRLAGGSARRLAGWLLAGGLHGDRRLSI